MPRHVTLVCGPPCAGKSTWVRQHAQPGDLVVCFDQLAQAAGSPRAHGHADPYRVAAVHAYAATIHTLPDYTGRAWVIRCAPRAHPRATLAATIHADETLILKPPRTVALARARRTRPHATQQAIRRWYARWQPGHHERVID